MKLALVIARNIAQLVVSLKGRWWDGVGREKCLDGAFAEYIVSSDARDIKVCAACAKEARRLGLAVKALHPFKLKP